MSSRGRLGAVASLLIAVAVGCGGGGRAARTPFVAVWQAADSAAPSPGEQRRLAAAGASERFVEAATIEGSGELPRLAPRALPSLAQATPVSLVVTGRWNATPSSERRLVAAWRDDVEAMVRAAGAAGGVAVGIHFELEIAAGARHLARALDRLRDELGTRLFVSLGVASPLADDDTGRALAEAVDFLVVDAFGQPPGAIDDAGHWDLATTEAVLARLAAADRPYAVALWTRGRAELRRGSEAPVPLEAGVPLARLLRSPRFSPRPGAVFAGIDRQVFELEARERVAVGPWTLDRGDRLWVARPTTHDLEEALRRVAPPAGPRVGIVLRELAPGGDTLSLAADQLAAALEPGDATPDLVPRLVEVEGGGGRAAARLRLENFGAEPTDLGGGEWNFVQLEFPAGALVRVELGDFAGWEPLWQGRERRTLRALRQADTLRLYVPYVGGGERLDSGVIEWRTRAGERPPVKISGRFLLPGGREWSLAATPAEWISEYDGGRRE